MRANHGNALAKLLVVLVIIGVAVGVAYVRLRESAIVAEVQKGKAVDAVPGSVVVHADKDLQELKIEGSGRVVECARLDPGMPFKKDDVLLRLDTTDIERAMADAKRLFETNRELARIRNERNSDEKVAQQRLENVRRLHDLGNQSTEDVNTAQRQLDAVLTGLAVAKFTAKKDAEEYERSMEASKLLLKKMTVVAPTDGMVESGKVNVGTLVNAGATVGTFYSNDRVVIAKISEEDIAKVKLGDPAEVQLLSFPGKKFEAKVTKILPFADPETRRYNVYLDVKAELLELRPNSTGEVVITVGTHDDVPLVPRRAIFNSGNGYFVLVVKGGRVERRQVDIGYRAMNSAEVIKGLAPGEKVIVENLDLFRDGQRVRVESAP